MANAADISGKVRLEVQPWFDRPPCQPEFEVGVGSGRSAGRSGQAYGITLAQGRSVTDIDPTQVGIAGLAAVAVVQANYVAVGATPARLDGHAVARDKNRAAAVDSDIDAAVKAVATDRDIPPTDS